MSKFIYNESLDFQNKPQEFKGIKFYPILISEHDMMMKILSVLGIPKNYIKNNIQIMKSSYLKFLYFFLKKSDELKEILSFVTKEEDVSLSFSIKDKPREEINLEDISVFIEINNIKFNETDFDIIRDIILKQNYYSTEYFEEYDPELEEFLQIANAGYEDNSWEDKIFVLSVLLQKNPEEIGKLSYYQFYKLYSVATLEKTTEIYQPLFAAGFIKFEGKKKLKTYLDPLPTRSGRYDSIKMSEKDFLEKVGMQPQNKSSFEDEQNIELPKIK